MWLHAHPTISLGAELANPLSGEILKARRAVGKDQWTEGHGGFGAFEPSVPGIPAVGTNPGKPGLGVRVALWGAKAVETRNAVESYSARTKGLQEFLTLHAGWTT